MEIAGKAALVTGGASGLGAATVRLLHGAGARVVIADVAEHHGRQLAGALGERALFVRADVTAAGEMARAVEEGTARFGELSSAVCCAGIGPPGRVLGREGPAPLEWFDQTVRINLIGSFNTVRLVAASMAKNAPDAGGERGVIVMTASVAAYEGQVGQAAYAASKGGIVAMTLPIAREFASLGIRVMTIAPGLFDTPLLASLPEEARASLGQQVTFPSRLGRPEEYAAQVAHIIASPMLNGSVIRLDGAIRMAPR
jgi:NAD(P)-dependent dehydrogenase (short-subunit alcohol dehydrogenase family)